MLVAHLHRYLSMALSCFQFALIKVFLQLLVCLLQTLAALHLVDINLVLIILSILKLVQVALFVYLSCLLDGLPGSWRRWWKLLFFDEALGLIVLFVIEVFTKIIFCKLFRILLIELLSIDVHLFLRLDRRRLACLLHLGGRPRMDLLIVRRGFDRQACWFGGCGLLFFYWLSFFLLRYLLAFGLFSWCSILHVTHRLRLLEHIAIHHVDLILVRFSTLRGGLQYALCVLSPRFLSFVELCGT